jgi:(S)-mandelate dehydrogenase
VPTRIDQALNLDDLRLMARRRLPRMAFDFIEGGVDDEKGLARNRAAFDAWQLLPRFLNDVQDRKASATLFGKTYSTPIGISPMGLAGLFRHGADLMMAQAAAEANVPFIMSGSSNESIEKAMQVAPDHAWFQLYCTRDENINRDLIERACAARVNALVLTVDVTVNANRERNLRNGFVRPFRLTPSILLQAITRPGWLAGYLRHGSHPMMQNWQPYAPPGASADDVADLFARLTPSPVSTWKTLENARRWWPGPLMVKGLLHPDDARQAVALGADGVIVSNHGARQLDAAPSPLEVLPAMRAAVPGTPLIIDSGIRRGSDIVMAFCLGAQFALAGRPMMYGVAAAGAPGVARAIRILHSEVDKVLAQLGCRSMDELHAGLLRRAGPERISPDDN